MSSEQKTDNIHDTMPILVSNEGVWEGWYRYYDAKTGQLTDQHRSRLLCRLIEEDGKTRYHQTNYYFWDDGKTEIRDFPAWYENGRVWWDNDLIKGWAAQMSPDDNNRSTCLNWVRKGEPDVYLYEMIQNSDDRTNRARTWQWFRNGLCFQRTLIDETFITRDWANFDVTVPPKI